MTSPFLGFIDPSNSRGEYNAHRLIVERILADVHTATLVLVKSCTNSGTDSAVGYVDVQPLVQMVAPDGSVKSRGTIHNIPYMRLQGGSNAVIIDPQVGDIGICLFAERDLSSVKNTKAEAAPGSGRTFDYADGLYIGGVLNGVPQQYVRFSTTGVEVVSPTTVNVQAPAITLTGNTTIAGTLSQTGGGSATFSGSLTATGDVTGNGTSLHSHTHPDPQGGNTGAPN